MREHREYSFQFFPGLSRKRGLNFAGVKRTNLINFIFRESKLSADPGFIRSGFEQLGPGARFSKVLKLFERISGDIILFVSSKRRRLEARNFAIILNCIPFTIYQKPSFTE